MFTKKDENGEEAIPFLSSLKKGIKSKVDTLDKSNVLPIGAEGSHSDKRSIGIPMTPLPAVELPDLDAVAGYLLQFASKIGKVNLATNGDNVSKESLLAVRNFSAILYFADWEFTRRNNRRLTEVTWHSSDFDYNVNTASRFDVVLDHDMFDFFYKTLGDKKNNQVLYKLSLNKDYVNHDFANSLDTETKTHLEYIIAACISSDTRPRTFPAAYEPKGGDARTYYDLDLMSIANLERKEYRIHPKPFVNLREKRFDPAQFAQLRDDIQYDFYKSFDDHDARFSHGLLKIVGDSFFRDNPEKLYIKSVFPTPLWEMNKDIAVTATDTVGLGSEYSVNIAGRSFYIFAQLTLDEYASLTESQREFFKPAPNANTRLKPGETMKFEFRGDCSISISLHVTIDTSGDTSVKTSFAEAIFKLA